MYQDSFFWKSAPESEKCGMTGACGVFGRMAGDNKWEVWLRLIIEKVSFYSVGNNTVWKTEKISSTGLFLKVY